MNRYSGHESPRRERGTDRGHLRLDELAAQRAHEFALIVEPLEIEGGTGSSVAPIAIR
jgi:hypothetical protein